MSSRDLNAGSPLIAHGVKPGTAERQAGHISQQMMTCRNGVSRVPEPGHKLQEVRTAARGMNMGNSNEI